MGIADVAVQEIDDGFRQRRWLVEYYAACWNNRAAWTDEIDPEVAGEVLVYYQDWFSDAARASSEDSSIEDSIRLDGKLVAALAALKVVEAWIEAGIAEIGSGQKRSHWMWYVFPQVDGLGFSPVAKRYALRSAAEAEAYLHHPVLGPRLTACAEAALSIRGRSAREIFGSPDDLKLRSSATLFAAVSPAGSVFHQVLDRYFKGEPDQRTLDRLGAPR